MTETKQQHAMRLLKETKMSRKAVAAEVGISLTTLYDCIRLDKDMQVRSQGDVQLQKDVAAHYADNTLVETCAKFELSPPTVLRYVKKHGLTRGGDRIMEQGYFFGSHDRETLGLTAEQVASRNELLVKLGLDFQASEIDQCMYLVRGTKRFRLTVEEAIAMTKDVRTFLQANAARIKETFK